METDYNDSDIAIISVNGRFPGAKNIDEFWQNLRDGVESVSFFSEKELKALGVGNDLIKDPNYVNAGAVLEDIEMFDADFFGYSHREAEIADPQQRLFLECAWEVLEKAGYNTESFKGLIGVYAGVGESTYLLNNFLENSDQINTLAERYQLLLGNSKDFLCTRVSYKLNLKGPGITVQTACSTSLVAVHLACQSLLNWECDMALAGGVSIGVPQKTGYLYQKGMIMSSDGHCRAFDNKADGVVGGNGVGIVLLKRLSDAIADGDSVQAIIKGSAVNNDGSLKVGYTAPGIEGQASVIADSLMTAEVDPETITYIEAHGTGTDLGDPVEIAALTQAFGLKTRKKGFCAIGSLKSNMGHLDAAAGVAGLIKTVLAMKYGWLPPSLHFEQPNAKIDFSDSPFYVNDKLTEWNTEDDIPRRAGVSSFGIGGTNAHVILEQAPCREKSAESRPYQLLIISAKTDSALEAATTNLSEYLKQTPDINLADVAYTLQAGRKHFNYRKYLVCKDINDAVTKLVSGKDVHTGFYKADQSGIYSDINKNAVDDFNTESGLSELGKQWLEGAEIDWSVFYRHEKRYRIPLPTYPFERKRYWVEPRKGEVLDKRPDVADWFHVPSWRQSPLPIKEKTELHEIYGDSSWLIFLDECGFGNVLAEKLKQTGQNVITVKIGPEFAELSEYEYSLNPEEKDDYESLCRSLHNEKLKMILHLWSVTNDYDSVPTSERLDKAQNAGFYSLLFLAQALGGRQPAERINIVVISNNMQEVMGEELLCPEKATLLGPVKVIPQEYRNITCRSVDILLPESGTRRERKLIENLITEFASESPDMVIAYRSKHRWVQAFEPVRLEKPRNKAPFRLRQQGVYLITGGLGGIGLTLAEYLAKSVQAKLILSGRSKFPERDKWEDWLKEHGEQDSMSRKIRKIEEMEKSGAKVLVINADAADPRQVTDAANSALNSFGKINGVIHSAGIADYAGIIQRRTIKMSEEVLAPKVKGTIALNSIVKNIKPDFFLLCSSLATVHYKMQFGQTAYVAANEFLDAFAHYKNLKDDLFVASVNWDTWQEVGMAVDAVQKGGARKEALQHGISCLEGAEIFNRILGNAFPRVIVSTCKLMTPEEQDAYIENLSFSVKKEESRSLSEPGAKYIPPENEVEQILADIWQECLGIEKIGTDDDFFELGGDSLLGTQVISRMQEQLGINLSVAVLFEEPTIAALSQHIEDIRNDINGLETIPETEILEGRKRGKL